jgi:hypothetical protein
MKDPETKTSMEEKKKQLQTALEAAGITLSGQGSVTLHYSPEAKLTKIEVKTVV